MNVWNVLINSAAEPIPLTFFLKYSPDKKLHHAIIRYFPRLGNQKGEFQHEIFIKFL